jgi:toxin-antitoxin system PIN domain toxin
VKLLDANILLYAYDSDSPHHAACRAWLDAALNSEETIALPWQTLLAFVRIATNSRAVRQPLSGPDACGIVSSWLERPNVAVVGAGDRFWDIFQAQVSDAQVSGPLVTDAALAALALEHGATLCSTDADFRRFRGLKLLNPTQAGASP